MARFTASLCVVVSLVALTVTGRSQEQEEVKEPASTYTWPAYNVRRFLEDYSGLAGRDSSVHRDLLDALKYIPLGESGDLWLSLSGQARLRMEGFGNFAFGAPTLDDDGFYLLQRYRFGADLHATRHLRGYVEGKVALADDRELVGGRRTLDVDTIALQQAFGELTLPVGEDLTLQVRGGRQDLAYGAQRLISPLDWANTRRTFDGVLGRVALGSDLVVDGFWTKPVLVDKYKFNEPDPQQDFWGVYAALAGVTDLRVNLEGYFLGHHGDPSNRPDYDRYTAGGRAHGKFGDTGIGYDVEGAGQFGDLGDRDIGAFFVSTLLTVPFRELPLQPVAVVGFDYASGDSDPRDGDAGTFSQLFPLGHAYHGFIDVVGKQNIIDLHHSLRVTPLERLLVRADGHVFWLPEPTDALYNAGGGLVRKGRPGADSYLGYEIDLLAKYTLNHHLVLLGGYSHFFAGDFLRDTGAHDDIDFWYLSTEFTF